MIVYGKALLLIRRTHEVGEERHPRYEVTPFIQSCSGDPWARDAIYQDFQLLEDDTLPLPKAAYKLKQPGDQVRVYVVYCFLYTRASGYGDDDDDITLEYSKERVRKWQPFNPKGWGPNP